MGYTHNSRVIVLRELQTETGLVTVAQRPADGYINITQIAKAAGKLVADWVRLADTQEYLSVLSLDMGFHIASLLQRIQASPG